MYSEAESLVSQFQKQFPMSKRPEPHKLTLKIQIASTIIPLQIELLRDFPRQPPLFSVLSELYHPFIDQNNKQIKNIAWVYRQTTLVSATQQIIAEFQKRPPSTNYLNNQNQQPQMQYPLFKELDSLSFEQLQSLNDNEAEREKFFHNCEEIKKIQQEKTEILQQNINIAKETLKLEQNANEIFQKYNAQKQLYDDELQTLNQLEKQVTAISNRFSVKSLQNELESRARQYQKETDSQVENFLKGQKNAQEFFDEFLEKRKEYHKLQAVREKIVTN